ncbi:hypothetical protein ACJRO7_009726 [Eucalyptus globulus]|uniref:Pentatricopeptide repeat-containing protein n=1 Tax=Eucalyptus globulus TaxID=34317 RepID=A0ABD3L9N9_EUCGL
MIFSRGTASRWKGFLGQCRVARHCEPRHGRLCSTRSALRALPELRDLCDAVSTPVGSLDDLESSLDRFGGRLTSSLVTQVIDRCKDGAPTRRLLRFFSWARKNLGSGIEDKDFNYAIEVFAEKKDHTAMEILISDLGKEGRVMDKQTYSVVAEKLVSLGREGEALGLFKNLEKFKCPQDSATVMAVVNALCSKGHAKMAEGVVQHHKSNLEGIEPCIYRCLLYGWSEKEDVKQARRIIKEMKSAGFMPDLFCFNTFLRCLCERNLKRNPSGLVPESLNVMMEMRTFMIAPNSISYNIVLSCLGRARRVKESCQILDQMKKSGCSPDWVSYYLVARVLYLSGRFGKGNKIVDEMIEQGLVPEHKFYYDLIGILCGVERVNHALELFERMKSSSLGGYGPVYDVLIPKLCRGGDFCKARELWDEAASKGVNLRCSEDMLNPQITEVFKPVRKLEDVEPLVCMIEEPPLQNSRVRGKKRKKKQKKKGYKKGMK